MKKVFSVFMIFFAVFLVSCGGLLEEEPRNTVRITMPGNGRAVSASGASDVKYYNIVIQNQTFSNVPPGTTVESAQLPVGMSVSISVEAIGKINDVQGAPVITERRIAYYQTSERLPAEGLTLNVNMANYKTEYHKVTLNQNGFNGQQTSVEVYVAGGSNYTLPNYGTYTPPQGAPRKHTTWESKQPAMVKQVGESITVTEDMEFAVKWDEYATITFEGNQNFKYWDNNVQVLILPTNWKSTDYVEKGKPYTLTDYGAFAPPGGSPYKHIGWSYTDSSSVPQNVGSKAAVLITGDMTFTVEYAESIPLGTGGNDIELNNSIYYDADRTKYYIWDEQPFTLPRRKKADGSYENVEWTFSRWWSSGTEISTTTWRSGVTVEYDDWKDWNQQVCGEHGMEIAPKN